jgi:hypothetical protein
MCAVCAVPCRADPSHPPKSRDEVPVLGKQEKADSSKHLLRTIQQAHCCAALGYFECHTRKTRHHNTHTQHMPPKQRQTQPQLAQRGSGPDRDSTGHTTRQDSRERHTTSVRLQPKELLRAQTVLTAERDRSFRASPRGAPQGPRADSRDPSLNPSKPMAKPHHTPKGGSGRDVT